MDRNVTVSLRGLLLVGLVALALVGTYLLGHARGAPASAADATSSAEPTVSVQGVGHVSVVPDQLAFALTVQVTRDDLNTSLEDANTTMQAAIDTVEAQGVDELDVQTTDLSMYPVYSHQRNQPRVFHGYRVSQSVTVTVEKLEDASRVVTAAVGAGGSGVRITDLRLQIADPDAALKPARTAAYEQARQKAEEYAADTGSELGDVVRISEVGDQPVSYEQSYSAADAASPAASPIPIQPGQEDLTAQVVLVFELR